MNLTDRIVRFFRRWLRRDFILLFGLAATFACAWAFIGIAEETGEGEHDRLEEKILRSLRQPTDPARLRGPIWLGEVVRDISALGGAAVTSLVPALVVGYLVVNGRGRAAATLTVAVVGGIFLTFLLKHGFDRARPAVVPYLSQASGPSFPSGHSMTSAVIYITLGVFLARWAQDRRNQIYFLGAGLLLSGLIGVSRVMLGVHYPSDVLAGWAAGTAWALVCAIAADLMQRPSNRTDWCVGAPVTEENAENPGDRDQNAGGRAITSAAIKRPLSENGPSRPAGHFLKSLLPLIILIAIGSWVVFAKTSRNSDRPPESFTHLPLIATSSSSLEVLTPKFRSCEHEVYLEGKVRCIPNGNAVNDSRLQVIFYDENGNVLLTRIIPFAPPKFHGQISRDTGEGTYRMLVPELPVGTDWIEVKGLLP